MAPRISERLTITGTLLATAPIHLGASSSGPGEPDLALATDGTGTQIIPGTGLAGVLRARALRCVNAAHPAERNRWAAALLALFGYQSRSARARPRGRASLLLVEDAPLSNDVRPEIRHGVAIELATGTAMRGALYERALLPAGAELSCELTLEIPSEPVPVAEQEISALLDAELSDTAERTPAPQQTLVPVADVRALARGLTEDLLGGALRVGAARTRGLGAVQLCDARIRCERLDTADGVLAALTARLCDRDESRPLQPSMLAERTAPAAAEPAAIEIRCDPRHALLVGSGAAGLGVDLLPLATSAPDCDKLALVLPGSSIKGVLRGHAQRIANTAIVDPAAREQIIDHLFGTAGDVDRQGRRGALGAEDCLARVRLDRRAWADAAIAADLTEAQQQAARAGLAHAQPRMHVAVDRWSQAPVRGALFSDLQPRALSWEPLRLSIDTLALPAETMPRSACLALLWLLLRALSDGHLAFGGGTNRGLGGMQPAAVALNSPSPTLACLLDAEGAISFDQPPAELLRSWQAYTRVEAA